MSRTLLSPSEREARRRATKAKSDARHRQKRSEYGRAYQAKQRARMNRLEMALAAIVAFNTPLPCGLLEQAREALKP